MKVTFLGSADEVGDSSVEVPLDRIRLSSSSAPGMGISCSTASTVPAPPDL